MNTYDEILKNLLKAEKQKEKAKQNNDLTAYLNAEQEVNRLKIDFAEWDGD